MALDDVISTQPELGPSIPDGGFGWFVLVGTLFFQSLIPCLIVSFGIFLAFSKLENGTAEDKNIMLWDDKLLYVALFYTISRCIFDSIFRHLSKTTNARLLVVVGTCLTCAGLLFMWMGMTGNHDDWLFIPAGTLAGFGSSLIIIQCDVITGQYFRLKLPILNAITTAVVYSGFIAAPIILGNHILTSSISNVLLWYQAIILQGLIVSAVFRKSPLLKSKQVSSRPYQFITQSGNHEDEEDVFSKNSRELQIRRPSSKLVVGIPEAGTSGNSVVENVSRNKPDNWIKFEDNDEEDIKYAKVDKWEMSDETESRDNWERFDDIASSSTQHNYLSLAEEMKPSDPTPLFSNNSVNNNNSYSFDQDHVDYITANVFQPSTENNGPYKKYIEILKEPTFYKSLFMLVGNNYSTLIFYILYPSYLYIQADSVNIRHMSQLIGILSFSNLIFLSIVYWIPFDNSRRAIGLAVFYFTGSIGYFMISDFKNESLLLIGGIQVILSIGALDHLGKPLLKLPSKGTSNENTLLTISSAVFLGLFLCLNVSFKACFRLMAVFHFFNGSLWLANYGYKKLRYR